MIHALTDALLYRKNSGAVIVTEMALETEARSGRISHELTELGARLALPMSTHLYRGMTVLTKHSVHP